MVSADIPLTAVLGLDPASPDDNTFTRDRVERVIGRVREQVKKHAKVPLPDVAPGIVREFMGSLRQPVSELALEVWNKRKEIRKFADITRYPPDEANEVWLKEHELEQSLTPRVEVKVSGVTALTIKFPATVRLTLHAAKLVIRGGRVTHLRLGDLSASAYLEADFGVSRMELLKVESKTWSLPGELALGDGIRVGGP